MAKQPRNLKGIKVREISLVDAPANKSPFLFFKREGEQSDDPLTKQKKIKIAIESDGTVGGTNISINGDKVSKLRSFDFSFYGQDPKQKIHASYTKVTDTEDGFSRTETYYLSKGENTMDKKILKALQAYLGTEEIDFEKKASEEDIQKALELIEKNYKEDFPQDLQDAVGVIAKCAANSFEAKAGNGDDSLEKAGAKFSKDAIKKLKAIIAAVEDLKSLLPDNEASTQKSDSNDDKVNELAKQLEGLKEVIEKLDVKEKDDEKSSISDVAKALKDISDRIKSLEDGGAVRKSISDQDSDGDDEPNGAGEDGKVLWPSLIGKK